MVASREIVIEVLRNRTPPAFPRHGRALPRRSSVRSFVLFSQGHPWPVPIGSTIDGPNLNRADNSRKRPIRAVSRFRRANEFLLRAKSRLTCCVSLCDNDRGREPRGLPGRIRGSGRMLLFPVGELGHSSQNARIVIAFSPLGSQALISDLPGLNHARSDLEPFCDFSSIGGLGTGGWLYRVFHVERHGMAPEAKRGKGRRGAQLHAARSALSFAFPIIPSSGYP
jgi:hypothetical protein